MNYDGGNMPYSKERIEESLKDLLYESLEGTNQEDGIIDLEYDEETGRCYVTLSTHIVEEDDYIGFSGY